MYRFMNEMLDPYRLLILLLMGACAFLWARQRENRRRLALVVLPSLLLLVISMPAVCFLALGTLEWRFAPIEELPEESEAIVVLAGWWMPADQYRPKPILGSDSIYRCLHAAELYRRSGPCLVVLSGGQAADRGDQPSIAGLMRALMIELGVPASDLTIEERSRSTFENAQECRKLLAPRSISQITLVTDATHMLRSVRSFEKAGFQVTPAPCDYKAGKFVWCVDSFLPSSSAAGGIQQVLHEWLGLAWYWMHGRV